STWIDDALSQQLNITKKDAPGTYKRYVDQQGEAIAMKWQILSKWTSFIIVDEAGKNIGLGERHARVKAGVTPSQHRKVRGGCGYAEYKPAANSRSIPSSQLFSNLVFGNAGSVNIAAQTPSSTSDRSESDGWN